jgi:NAD(P)-dependent dehydrogenase (short-subunit alcohol dehydrogenase family)
VKRGVSPVTATPKRNGAVNPATGSVNEFRLDGKIAVITGGGSGIGRAIALKFAANGAAVHIMDLSGEDARAVAQEITEANGIASDHPCDVGNQAEVISTFNQISRERIHVLINNAGISQIGNVENTTEADLDRILRVNVKGYYNCIYACIPHMKASGGGVILNMASIAGTAGLADRFGYSTSKGAVIAMTYSVARDYISYNIRCNCISPARVHTPFVDGYLLKNYPGREQEMYAKLASTQPIGRMGKPDEVASLALFLCSDAAAFITGVDYPLDGGFLNLHG